MKGIRWQDHKLVTGLGITELKIIKLKGEDKITSPILD